MVFTLGISCKFNAKEFDYQRYKRMIIDKIPQGLLLPVFHGEIC
jgi:hypothetical protein